MKKPLLLVLIVTSSIYSYAQGKFGLKIYQNTDFFESQFYESRFATTKKVNNVNFGRVSLALNIDKNTYIHEIELLIPEIRKPLDKAQFPLNYKFREGDTFDGKVSSYSSRYELIKALTKNDGRFGFLLGAGVNPYFVNIEYVPNTSNTFYASTKLYGLALNLTPRIKYNLSERFSVDLNVPLKIYDLRGEYNKTKNPAIPIRQQRDNSVSSIFFDTYTIRVGLMYKLS